MSIARSIPEFDPRTTATDQALLANEPVPWPITIATFSEMIRTGAISEKEKVYLWNGSLVRPISPNPPHVLAVSLCAEAIRRRLPPGFHVHEEKPLAFRLQHSLPEPDITVLSGDLRDYTLRHPSTTDSRLVIEVADSSLALDRRFAAELSSEDVPTYWIVNLSERCVEVYSDPAGGTYRQKRTFSSDEQVPLLIDGRDLGSIPIADILP